MKFKNKKAGQYKSQLEKYCADQLKKSGIEYWYEEVKIELTPSFTYSPISMERYGKIKELRPQRPKVQSITYTPDFHNSKKLDEIEWIIEIKGYFTPIAKLKWKLFKYWLWINKKNWRLFMPRTKKEVDETIKSIKNETEKNKNNHSRG